MKQNIKFLIANCIILFFMILFLEFSMLTKFSLWFLWASWSSVTAIMYAIIWRESVNCQCLEKERE